MSERSVDDLRKRTRERMTRHGIPANITCELRAEKIDTWAEMCYCQHPISVYESRTGPRCACCFGKTASPFIEAVVLDAAEDALRAGDYDKLQYIIFVWSQRKVELRAGTETWEDQGL
jgi:hypothetical protein